MLQGYGYRGTCACIRFSLLSCLVLSCAVCLRHRFSTVAEAYLEKYWYQGQKSLVTFSRLRTIHEYGRQTDRTYVRAHAALHSVAE